MNVLNFIINEEIKSYNIDTFMNFIFEYNLDNLSKIHFQIN